MNNQEIVESKCREIYGEVQAFFAHVRRQRDYGFKILNAPPIYKPRFLFVGYQPGGGTRDFEYETGLGSHLGWPSKCEYVTATWKLARNMQLMFNPAVLEQCVGMNAIFLRSPSVADYKRNIESEERIRIASFCKAIVLRIVDIIDPGKIVAIGFSTLNLFGPTEPDVVNDKGRLLTRSGLIGARHAIATLHLSGAYISAADRERIRDRVLEPSPTPPLRRSAL